MACCSSKCQIYLCVLKSALILIMIELCLNRSLTRRPSRSNRDFDRPRANSGKSRLNFWIPFRRNSLQVQSTKNMHIIVIVSADRLVSPPYSSLFRAATVATSSVILYIQFHVRSDFLVCGGSNSNATCQQFARARTSNDFICQRILSNQRTVPPKI